MTRSLTPEFSCVVNLRRWPRRVKWRWQHPGHAGVGILMNTLVEPVLLGSGGGLDGGWRAFVGVGRLFR